MEKKRKQKEKDPVTICDLCAYFVTLKQLSTVTLPDIKYGIILKALFATISFLTTMLNVIKLLFSAFLSQRQYITNKGAMENDAIFLKTFFKSRCRGIKDFELRLHQVEGDVI